MKKILYALHIFSRSLVMTDKAEEDDTGKERKHNEDCRFSLFQNKANKGQYG